MTDDGFVKMIFLKKKVEALNWAIGLLQYWSMFEPIKQEAIFLHPTEHKERGRGKEKEKERERDRENENNVIKLVKKIQ